MAKNKNVYVVPKTPYYTSESWLVKYWRPAAAWTYLLICVFDFIVMPVYTQKTNLGISDIMVAIEKLRPEDKVAAMTVLIKRNEWEPLTLAGGGMFHVAFGAILGVAAWTRGRVLETSIQNGFYPAEEPQFPTGMPMPPPQYAQQQPVYTPPVPPVPPQPPQPPQQAANTTQPQQPLPSQPPPFDPKSQYNNPG